MRERDNEASYMGYATPKQVAARGERQEVLE